jgi:hypothetical protein
VEFSFSGGALFVSVNGGPKQPVVPQSETKFFRHRTDVQVCPRRPERPEEGDGFGGSTVRELLE